MGRSEHKQQLITLARRRAFETYLRFGQMPRANEPPTERKAINPTEHRPIAVKKAASDTMCMRKSRRKSPKPYVSMTRKQVTLGFG